MVYPIKRHKTRQVRVGSVPIGGNNPVAVQSMTKTPTADIAATVKQARQLQEAGVDIIRMAILDERDARALKEIKRSLEVPLVADIHFNYKLALASIESGVDKIRLNPGNIYRKTEVREVADAARLSGIPIRVGINSGSLRGASLVKSALGYIRMLESFKFRDIVVSLKASSVLGTVQAYRDFARVSDYPLHLGLTATGPAAAGTIKSSVAIGGLLLEGIGDTIRVSLTERPELEVRAAHYILESLGLKKPDIEIISCPTCGRCKVGLKSIVGRLENKLRSLRTGYAGKSGRGLKVAVMGCMVNGPGEAKEADIGIAFASDKGLLFKHAKPVRKVALKDCVTVLTDEARKICYGLKHS